jgi:hypothetical protein
MHSILFFLLFLCAIGLWTWGGSALNKRISRDIGKDSLFWKTEMATLLSNLGFFAFIYLLSGMWNLRLVILFVAAGQLSLLMALVLNSLLGSQGEKFSSRVFAGGGELGMKYPKFSLFALAMLVVLLIAYLIVAGIIHFRYPWRSPALVAASVRYTLLFFISSYPFLMTEIIATVTSENLDEDTRQGVFISQMTALIPTALFAALALWAFGVGGPDLPVYLGSLSHSFSLRVTLIVVAYFFALILVPYFIGTQRGKRKRLALLHERQEYVRSLADILESPAGARYVPKLTSLRDQIAAERETVRQGHQLMLLDDWKTKSPADFPAASAPLVEAYRHSHELDPRSKFFEYLTKFETDLQEIIDDLQARPPETLEDAAAKWSKTFETRHAQLGEEIKGATSAAPLVTVAVGTVATAIVSPILAGVGKAAWAWISTAYGLKGQ